RRAAYLADTDGGKKKKKGKRGRGRRVSDQKDKEGTPSVKSKTPPVQDKEKKEPTKQTGKRKSREESQDVESKVSTRPRHLDSTNANDTVQESTPAQKLQKVSETKAV